MPNNGSIRFQTARFHKELGPDSLFERVAFKMQGNRKLKLHSSHYRIRKTQRSIEQDIENVLLNFNSNEWNLVTAEVRVDTGKFVNSTWERVFPSGTYWVTIGLGDTVQTIIRKDSSGKGYSYEQDDDIFNFVRDVNRNLMSSDTSRGN